MVKGLEAHSGLALLGSPAGFRVVGPPHMSCGASIALLTGHRRLTIIASGAGHPLASMHGRGPVVDSGLACPVYRAGLRVVGAPTWIAPQWRTTR
jgi:hypothetical protein